MIQIQEEVAQRGGIHYIQYWSPAKTNYSDAITPQIKVGTSIRGNHAGKLSGRTALSMTTVIHKVNKTVDAGRKELRCKAVRKLR